MQNKPIAKRIIAILLLLLIIFGGVNLFWYGFKYLPYKKMAAQMQRIDASGRPKYTYTDGDYLFQLKMPGYLSFQSGFLYIVEKDKEDAASFVADENGNLTEKHTSRRYVYMAAGFFSASVPSYHI